MRIVRLLLQIMLCVVLFTLVFYSRTEAFSLEVKPNVIYVYSDVPAQVSIPLVLKNGSDDIQELTISFLQIDSDKNLNNYLSYMTKSAASYNELFQTIEIQENGKKLETIDLIPREGKKVEMIILLDSKHAQKDYYFSIVLKDRSRTATSEKSSSFIRSAIALPVLLSTNYKSPKSTIIEEFSTFPIVWTKPVSFKVLVNNNSEHFVTSKGLIEITSMFGQIVAKIEIPEQAIFSRSKRYIGKYETSSNVYNPNINQPAIAWNENFMFGLYKATVNLEISGNQNNIARTIWFFAIPAQAFIILVIILSIVISIYLRVIHKLRPIKAC